ncbi:hypothetical protein [Paraconexibacter algicola]|uniref:Uncharacterized protein n=1 Tax=Paraconexibacter algicola TaxID=2133960 RepID=A0A2T4UJ88_9ACTN|nr:hypothetical protein [Paraconexibacter algicola]PTL59310.1 hypothetical protein C7Y72_06420 [Paraconexibacter algicola]
MPPVDRFVPRFAAEPPQELLPYGRWADRLKAEFLAACARIDDGDDDEDLGETTGEISWYPDRTWNGRTYIPASIRTTENYELYGYVSYLPATEKGEEPSGFFSTADYTAEIAEANPDWQLDLCEEVIGGWRGEEGNVAAMTLVWGRPLVDRGAVVVAELADLPVDQCVVQEGRFTLIAPDAYRKDYLDIRLFDDRGTELACESLYEDDEEEAGEA